MRRRRGRECGRTSVDVATRTRTAPATPSTDSAKLASWRGLALRRARKLSDVLMSHSPLGDGGMRCRVPRLVAQVLEDGPKPAAGAVQPSARRHRETTEDVSDLGGRQAFPLGQQQDLAVACSEVAQRFVHQCVGGVRCGQAAGPRPPAPDAAGGWHDGGSTASGSRSLAAPSRTARPAPRRLRAALRDGATRSGRRRPQHPARRSASESASCSTRRCRRRTTRTARRSAAVARCLFPASPCKCPAGRHAFDTY